MIWPLCEQWQNPVGVSADVAAGGGDVVGAGDAVTGQGEVAQGGHVRGTVSATDLGQIFGEGDIADPMQAIFYVPVRRMAWAS